MPPTPDPSGESFRGLLLRLRGRIHLTQRDLAAQMGVHVHSIQGWEAGSNYPGVASLRALIAAAARAGAFTPGHEADEAAALWAAAAREAPRLRIPFDRAWFGTIVPGQPERMPDESARGEVATPPSPVPTGGTLRASWGQAPDVVGFVGRATEREMLAQWVLDERCRVVGVLGLGGIGKSLLATRLAHDLAPSFEYVFWRSLRDAPTPSEWLAEALGLLAPGEAPDSAVESGSFRRLLELLGEARCLLVLDNAETVLQPGGPVGAYRAGYERYGTLLRQVGEAPHRSCLIVTSREEPSELRLLRGDGGPVRALELGGLGVEDGRALLRDKRLEGDEAAWQALIQRYGGNGLALRVVGETIRELFGGSVADYLEYVTVAPGVMVGRLRELLEEQMQRLSDTEHELLRRMVVEREPVGLAQVATDLGPRIGRVATLEAAEGLRRRSLLERTDGGRLFGLHSVVLEYVTEQVIEDVSQELASGELVRLLLQPLMKATAKEYVRRSQERLIFAPIVEQLVATHGSSRAAEQRLVSLLDIQRGRPVEDQGYVPGNLVNLLRLLRGDLKGVDLSGLTIRQVYLQVTEAQDADLADSYLTDSVLAESFDYPSSMAISGNGAFIAVGTSTGEIFVWRVADRTLIASLRESSTGVWGLALSEEGRRIVSSNADGVVKLWDIERASPLATFEGHHGGVVGVDLRPDGEVLISSGNDGAIKIWDARSRRLLTTFEGEAGGVSGLMMSRDGTLVGRGTVDGAIQLWETGRAGLRATLKGHDSGHRAVALSRSGRFVASGGYDGTVRLWDAETGQSLPPFEGHAAGVWSVALSEDSGVVASGSFDGTVRLWEPENTRPLATLTGHAGGVWGVALSADGTCLASASEDGQVRLWDAPAGRLLAELHGYTGGFWGVALRGDGGRVAGACVTGVISWWDATSGRLLEKRPGHSGGTRGVALSGSGQILASSGHDGTINLWDAESGRLVTTLSGISGGVWGVTLSDNGRVVANGGEDGAARLWDTATGRLVAMLQGHTGGVRGVALSSDGSLAATSGEDGTVKVWDGRGGELQRTLKGYAGGVWGVGLGVDGMLVAGGNYDGTVTLWEAASGRQLASMIGHTGVVYGVQVSRDGHLLATGAADGDVRLWEVSGGRLLATLSGHTAPVYGVSFSADGRMIASGSIDGSVRLWDVPERACIRVLMGDRRFERMDISGLTGVTEAQRRSLLALGAVERRGPPPPISPAQT